MRISALIPTYNRRAQILRAIDSVFAQTVPIDEIIVVDDGSTDGTPELIRERYGSAVVLITQQNAGASAARNRGICAARGRWIAFLDSDDIWLPTKVECQLEVLTNLGAEYGLCSSDTIFDGNSKMKLSRFQEMGFKPDPGAGTLDEPIREIVAWRNPFVTSSLLIRRSLLAKAGGFDEALVIGEDQDLMLRLSFLTKFCFVTSRLVQMDRDPMRTLGLEKLFGTRDDRLYGSFESMYSKWLKLPEVIGTKYEQAICELLRLTYYSSIEAKLHELRVRPALDRIRKLRALDSSYRAVAINLLIRKLRKLCHISPEDIMALG